MRLQELQNGVRQVHLVPFCFFSLQTRKWWKSTDRYMYRVSGTSTVEKLRNGVEQASQLLIFVVPRTFWKRYFFVYGKVCFGCPMVCQGIKYIFFSFLGLWNVLLTLMK